MRIGYSELKWMCSRRSPPEAADGKTVFLLSPDKTIIVGCPFDAITQPDKFVAWAAMPEIKDDFFYERPSDKAVYMEIFSRQRFSGRLETVSESVLVLVPLRLPLDTQRQTFESLEGRAFEWDKTLFHHEDRILTGRLFGKDKSLLEETLPAVWRKFPDFKIPEELL